MSALLIGIAGGTASGKTTLARILKDSFQDKVTILKHDYYYYDRSHFKVEDNKINFDHPDSFETDLLVKHLKELKNIGIIQGNIEGTSVCYCINQEKWNEIETLFKSFFGQKPINSSSCC